jgi:hypothetical protein
MATRRDDLKHGTNAAYVAGCVCMECREHQRQRMAKSRANEAQPEARLEPDPPKEAAFMITYDHSACLSRACA